MGQYSLIILLLVFYTCTCVFTYIIFAQQWPTTCPVCFRASSRMGHVRQPMSSELDHTWATQCTPWLGMLAHTGVYSAPFRPTGLACMVSMVGAHTCFGSVVKVAPNLHHALVLNLVFQDEKISRLSPSR